MTKNLFKRDFVYHLFIWLLLIVNQILNQKYVSEINVSLFVLLVLVNVGLTLMVVYFNFLYLIPYFQKKKRHLIFFGSNLILCGVFYYLSRYISDYVSLRTDPDDKWLSIHTIYNLLRFGQYLIFCFLLYNLKEKFEQEKKMGRIQVEKLKTEMNYLKAQINPHFLFNTLNNLYGRSLEKSEKTPEVILRLSKIMDYMLFESDEIIVYLKKDIDNLENYLAIEKIRQGNNAVINFDFEGAIDNRKIAPLLFLPLIENAFKHGVNTLIKDAYLAIKLIVNTDHLTFSVKNNYAVKEKNGIALKPGLGLSNLQKRLDLFYPGKHTLTIQDVGGVYEIQLMLNFI